MYSFSYHHITYILTLFLDITIYPLLGVTMSLICMYVIYVFAIHFLINPIAITP
ncbi:hypothetical protein GQ44DRAFT_714759 [Phaeosphaeriaceae sp. PMI808]|nr:hypothetical protein GQ44DRAFT_714759 [Phaeosphaeriaceae sp. PMI808]